MTHLDVIEVNVNVVDIKSKEEYEEDSEKQALPTGEFASKTEKAKSYGTEHV